MARFDFASGSSFRVGRHHIPPVTGVVLAANLLTFLLEFFSQRPLFAFLDFVTPALAARPWSPLTYVLHGSQDILLLLLGGYVFFWVGATLERQWGALEFGLFLGFVTALGALSYLAASVLFGTPLSLSGLAMPLGSVFLAWCMLNPQATVMFMMVVPIQARWLGYADLVLLYFGTRHPILGLFALVAPLVAWFYAVRGRWFRSLASRMAMRGRVAQIDDYRPAARRRAASFNPLNWWKRRQRRKEVEAIVKRMGLEDAPRGTRKDDDVLH